MVAKCRLQTVGRRGVDPRRLRRIERQLLIEVPEDDGVAVKPELQLSALQYASVLIAEDRQQQLRLQLRFNRMPVDVKEDRRG